MQRNFKINIGDKFKEWTVISEEFKKWDDRVHLCRCKCGKEQIMVRSRIISINSHFKCASCRTREFNEKKRGRSNKSLEDLGGTFINTIMKGAKRRNLTYDLTKEFLWELFLKQNKKCALSGLDIELSSLLRGRTPRYDLITASLDRIDNSKGYVEGNVQWVHKIVNKMKNTLTDKEFIFLCSKISEFRHDDFEPSLVIGNVNLTRKVQRLIGDDDPSNNPNTSAQHPSKG